jgi:hypothetical protein
LLKLAEQDDNGAVRQALADNGPVLQGNMDRLLRTSSFRWDNQAGGKPVGSFVDVETERRQADADEAIREVFGTLIAE